MKRQNLNTTLIVIFLLGAVCITALARDVVPGSVLHLDAIKQNGRDVTWRNLGLAGGEIPTAMADQTPDLDSGDIRIPDIGFSHETKWYTAKGVGQAFASAPGGNARLKLGDWTAEFLAKRNGAKWPGLVVAAEFAGFRSDKNVQGLKILMHGGDTGKFSVWIKGKKSAKGKWFGADALGIDIDEKEWHWIAFVFTNRQSLVTYQNGKKVGAIPTNQNFDSEEPVWVTVFSAWNNRAFNGAISVFRMYDRTLSEKELNQNITGDLAVERANKLATTWAKVRTGLSAFPE